MKFPEKYRVVSPLMPDLPLYIVKSKEKRGQRLSCIATNGEGWDHVSVTVRDAKLNPVPRCPTWGEMCQVKNLFWEADETVVQIHPPESEYVNNHEYCLHLWKPQNETFPSPNPALVGVK